MIAVVLLAAACVGWIEVTPRNGVWDDYYRRTDDPANCSFRFRVTREADRIGVEALVRDDKVVVDDCPLGSVSCPTWKDDCLEVFFDGDDDRNPNARGPEYETNPTPCNAGGEYAIAANGASQSDYASAKKCFGTLWGGTAEPWLEGGARVGTHYRLSFSYACLKRPTPGTDEEVRFGFNICVHDDDDGGANDLALYWKGNPKIPYADESAFGRMTLPPYVPSAPFNALVPVDWSNEPPERHVDELRRLYGYGFRKFVLIAPWCGRYFGHGNIADYVKAGRDIAFAQEVLKDLKDVEIGWWLAPSIGFTLGFPGQRVLDCDGNEADASCPLSKEFADALCARVEACLREAKPRVMFVEDDYTLSNHGGMNAMKGCFCPLHLAEFAKRVGKTHTAKEIAAMFRNPMKENEPLRRAFAMVSRDSLSALAARVRKTIDRVDPTIRVCLCQSGFCDVDGFSTEVVARAFAGGTRPMTRIFGACYFAENAAELPGVLAHAVWTVQHLPSDIEVIHETDPYPHTRFYNSSLHLYSEIAAAVVAGVSGSYYYCTQYNDDPLGDPGYAERFRAEAKRLAAVRDLRTTMKPCGVRMVYDPAEVYMYRETDRPAATGMLPTDAYFLGKMGLPMTAVDDATCAVLFGTSPNGLSDEEIGKILSGGVLLDAEAAILLCKRGFADQIGCEAVEWPKGRFFHYEKILPAAGCAMRGKKVYNRLFDCKPIIGWTPKKIVNALLKPRPGTVELSSVFDYDNRKVAPATLYYRNAKGGRVGVMMRSLETQPHPSVYSERKQELLMNLFSKLSDGRLEVCAPTSPSVWLLAAKNDRELLVMAENLAGEPRDGFVLRFAEEWVGGTVSTVMPDGSLRAIGVLTSPDFTLPSGSLPPVVPEFYVVRKKD